MPQRRCKLCGGSFARSTIGDFETDVCLACGPASGPVRNHLRASRPEACWLAVASIVSPLFAGPCFIPLVGLDDFWILTILYTPFALVACLLGGLPLHFLFKRRGWSNLVLYALGGMVLSLSTGLLVVRSLDAELVILAVPGLVCGTVFWLLAIGLHKQVRQRPAAA